MEKKRENKKTAKSFPKPQNPFKDKKEIFSAKKGIRTGRKFDLSALFNVGNLKKAGVVLAVILLILIARSALNNRTYNSYSIVSTSNQEDTISTKYAKMDGKILRYSSDLVSLVNTKQEVLWTDACDFQDPICDICEKTAVVADRGGSTMLIYGKDGRTGEITTSYSILKVKVAKQGVVAAILDGGEDTWINFYASDGTLIAENQTRVDEPGYPMDLAISPDGMVIMVAYQFVDGSQTTGYVAFYNFGTAGQSQIDNIVSGYTYEGAVVPEVKYLNSTTSVAFRDDGFAIFEGRQIPKEIRNVEVEDEIISTFCDDDHIGLVFKDSGEEDEQGQVKRYKLEVYNLKGMRVLEKSFNIAYTNITMSDGTIVMYNNIQTCILNEKGRVKYNGSINEGTVKDLFKIGWNKYLLVLDNGVNVIRLS